MVFGRVVCSGGWFVVVLVDGLLVIPDSRRFLSVEVTRWVGPCTMGESRLISGVEISCQVVRRQLQGTPANKDISICARQF